MNRDIITIGASAGGVEALKRVICELPADLQAAIFVVLHVGRNVSIMPELLNSCGPLRAFHPHNGEAIEYGRVYFAPPDNHLIIENGHVHLSKGPRENRVRPAVDPLFRSAALAYGPRVIGVILSGMLDDGTLGLWEIKRRGGIGRTTDLGCPAGIEACRIHQQRRRVGGSRDQARALSYWPVRDLVCP